MKSRTEVSRGSCLCVIVVGAKPMRIPGQPADSTSRVLRTRCYDGHLSPNVAVATFSHIDRLFPTRTVHHGTHVYPLPDAARRLTNFSFTSRGKKWDLYDYLAVNRIAGLLMLKDGQIVLKLPALRPPRDAARMSMSLAKSITASSVRRGDQAGLSMRFR